MQSIEQTLAAELANRVGREIDLTALAKKLAPQIEKRVVKTLLQLASDPDYLEDWLMGHSKLEKAFGDAIARGLKKLK